MDRQSAVVRRSVDPHSSAGQVKTNNTAVASVSDKHFLAEDPDTHDEVIVLGQAGTHKTEELARDLPADRVISVMGCIVNGPGESRHADIGISLPGTGESPSAPVYMDGEKVTTLKGDAITAEFLALIDRYVSERYKS